MEFKNLKIKGCNGSIYVKILKNLWVLTGNVL